MWEEHQWDTWLLPTYHSFVLTLFWRLSVICYWLCSISSVMHTFWLVLTYDLLEDRRIDDVIIKTFFNSLLYKTNRFQVAVCLFSDWYGQAAPCVPLFCSYHILTSSVIEILNRCMATWNLLNKHPVIWNLLDRGYVNP